jgi:ribonuclease VapC
VNGGPLVIDTSALLAVLFAEDEAPAYAQLLQSAASLRMTAPTWVESMQVATARHGNIGREGLEELLSRLKVEIVAFDADLASLAYEAWLRFGKGRHPAGLNFGDCFSYALAKQRGEPLLFKGDDFSRTDLAAAP